MAIVEPEMPIPRRTARRVSVFAGCDDFILVDVPFLNTTGRLINISEDGLAVHFAGPVAECATMEVSFSLGGERLTDTCQVIWSMPTSRGLRFLGLSAEQRRQIRSWMERRSGRRVNVFDEYNGVILVDAPSLSTTGRLTNLSEDGLAVHFASPIPEDTTIEVAFSLGDYRLTATCEVIWSSATCRGLRFLSLSEEERRQIRSRIDALRLISGLPSKPKVNLACDDVAADEARQRTIEQEIAVRGEQNFLAEEFFPHGQALTEPIVAAGFSEGAAKINLGEEPDLQPRQDLRLTTAHPDTPSAGRSSAAASPGTDGRRGRFQEDWARRMVDRQRAERRWRAGYLTQSDVGEESARSPHMPAGTVPPPVLTIAPDDNRFQEALTDTAVTRDHPKSARDQVWPVGIPPHQEPRSAIGWLLVLAVSAAALAIYLYLSPQYPTLLARSAGSRLSSGASVAIYVVEVVEGEPVLHGRTGANPVFPKITSGTAILRDMPAFDSSVLAPNAEADVRAVLTINGRGMVEGVRIISGTASLAKEVTAAAAHWRYTPYLLDSKPVTIDLPVTLKFRPRGHARQSKARISKRQETTPCNKPLQVCLRPQARDFGTASVGVSSGRGGFTGLPKKVSPSSLCGWAAAHDHFVTSS
jgi:PilZ domain-containing protein/TonB-like protein